MTVSMQITKRIYAGNGVTRQWDVDFPLNSSGDLCLYITSPAGAEEKVTEFFELNSDATQLTYPTLQSGLAPLAEGWSLTLVRQTPLTQETDLIRQGELDAEVLERGYDKLTLMVQELDEKVSRSIKYPVSSSVENLETDNFLKNILTAKQQALDASAQAVSSASVARQSAQEAQLLAGEAVENIASAGSSAQTALSAAGDAQAARLQAYVNLAQTEAQTARYYAERSIGKTVGEVYLSQSAQSADNPGALPLFTGETIAGAEELYPDFYDWVQNRTGLQCTTAEYEAALEAFGECPKYATKFPVSHTVTVYKYDISSHRDHIIDPGFNSSLFGYNDADGNFVQVENSNVFYSKISLNDMQDDVYYPLYLDEKCTKQIRIRRSSFSPTQESYYFVIAKDYNSVSVYPHAFFVFQAEKNSADDTYSSVVWTSSDYFPIWFNHEDSTYETVSSTVTTYEPNGSLRLPFLKNYIKCATAADGITQSKAGLPNITGVVDNNSIRLDQAAATSGAFSAENNGRTGVGTSNGSTGTKYTFDASRCSASYGASDTVTPAHTTLYPWVCAYNAAVPASTAQAGQFQEALSGKVDLPSGKTQADVDYVAETYRDGEGNWYRKYKSGWIEQGGRIVSAASGFKTVNFLKPFADANYTLVNGTLSADNYPKSVQLTNLTQTSFDCKVVTDGGSVLSQNFFFMASGQGAE